MSKLKRRHPGNQINPESSQIEKDLDSSLKEFSESQISEDQNDLILDIKQVIDRLDLGKDKKGFSSWTGEKLVAAREKLARYSEPLGEWISFHETRSDFSYIWRKGKFASDWAPIKTKLSDDLKTKVTNVEVENSLTEKYLKEQYYSMFHRRRADLLVLTMEMIDRMIRSIDSRLRELERQRRLPQEESHKPFGSN